MNFGCDQLAIFLKSKGVSSEGVDSVRGNGISGDMFMQFCEEDIRDAFTVFKDRFTVRKVIRELKLGQSVKPPTSTPHSSPQSATPSSLQRTTQHTPRVPDQRTSYQNNADQHRLSFSGHMSNGPMKSPHSERQLFMPSTEPQRSSYGGGNSQQSAVSMMSRMSNDSYSAASMKRRLSTDHIKREPPENRLDSSTGVCIDLRPKPQEQKQEQNSVFPYGSPQLMNATVSSTEEELRAKRNNLSPLHRPGAPYPVCLTQIIPSSSQTHSQSSPLSVKPESNHIMSMAGDKHPGQRSPLEQLTQPLTPAMVSPHRYDDSGSFMLSLVSSSISRFSGEELLGKKPVRGRPTEAQRLGTVLIRNAAQSVRIWDSAPLWKDIPHEKREGFMQYVVSTAPQLASYTELVWNRLREALQNRRKYLLDKETGRRVLKSSPLLMQVKDDPSMLSINIADVRGLIDLTEQHEQEDTKVVENVKTEAPDDDRGWNIPVPEVNSNNNCVNEETQ